MPAPLPIVHEEKLAPGVFDVQSIDSAWPSGIDRYRAEVIPDCSLAPVASPVIALEQARRRARVQVRGVRGIYSYNVEPPSRQPLVSGIPRVSPITALDQSGAARCETVD